ncbi:MAG: hypothetical protein ACE5ID_02420, partial [Acidobacteriota bacterium]
RFLTSGTRTDLPPFDAAGGYQGNNSPLTAEVAEGERIPVVPTAADALQGAVDVPAVLQNLATALRSDDVNTIRSAISEIDQAIDHLGAVRAKGGAVINRIDAGIAHRLDVRETLLAEASTLSGANLPDLLVELQQVNQARDATLASGARIAGPTLFDFLR